MHEEMNQGARFDDTDDEENEENNDNLVLADYNGDDLPRIEWNMNDPELSEGTVFGMIQDRRNALTTYCILTMNYYDFIKSEPTMHPLCSGAAWFRYYEQLCILDYCVKFVNFT
jgi:hypothetical protein